MDKGGFPIIIPQKGWRIYAAVSFVSPLVVGRSWWPRIIFWVPCPSNLLLQFFFFFYK